MLENHSENNLKPDLSNDTTANPPLFSLVNTFKAVVKTEGDASSLLRHLIEKRSTVHKKTL
jgi:hypothetical protein